MAATDPGSIDDASIIWLATTRVDGRPHLVPIWFVFADRRFWVATGAASVKVRNVAATPWAVVSLESGTEPRVAEGPARIHPRPFPPVAVAGFARKFDWDITVDVDEDVGEIALIEIEVRRWVFGGP